MYFLTMVSMLLGVAAEVQQQNAAQSQPSAEPLLVGVAETDITPPMGFPISGYYHERLATGVRDPLKAKAVVFRQGAQQAAFVIVDLTGVSRDLCIEVRQRASKKTGIPAAHIAVSATHSHTGPDYTKSVYQFLEQSKVGSSETSASEPATEETRPYPEKLIDGIVEAIVQASSAASAVQIRAGMATQTEPVSFNRRFVMKDGSIRTWQSLDNPQVVRPAGPIDPEVGLIVIDGATANAPTAVISRFALHLDTVGGLQWSADYPYYIEQTLRKTYGEQLVSVFAAGTCGDINHHNPGIKERTTTEKIGNSLGATIQTAIPALKEVKSPRFQVKTAVVNLPLQEVTEPELARARELLPAAKAGQGVDFFDHVSSYKAVVLDHLRNSPTQVQSTDFLGWGLSHTWQGVGALLPVDVMTMTFGDEVAIVFLPGEVFVELGLAIRNGSPYPTTLVVELSNCIETLYIPTRAAYAGGGYEVTNSAVEPGSGEMLVQAALTLLRSSAGAP